MKTHHILLVCSFIAFCGCTEEIQHTERHIDRIGVYDSRSVAVAFAGSEAFEQWMAEPTEQYKQAKMDGDTKQQKEIEAIFQERQNLMHKQGFSTEPVDNILVFIENKLPGIQKNANVCLLVSKWDQKTLSHYPAAEQIDVTMDLVDALDPTDRQRTHAINIQNNDPISLDEAEHIHD